MNLEVYGIRIFHAVIHAGSFTGAAKAMRLTQPTVSQQIAKLEQEIGQKLFERVGHDIIPTQTARDLYLFSSDLLEMIDGYQEKLQNYQSQPKGTVRYAMPESCQWTPHYRKIMSQIASFPDLRFEIGVLPNDLIVKGLIEGNLDFGFVTGERISPELRFTKFSDEAYSAVGANKKLFEPLQSKNFDQVRLITYPGWELFFTTWAKTHQLWKPLKEKLKEPTVHIGTLAGAIHAIQEGAGIGIIPTHCVLEELASKSLHEWKASKASATNPIYFAKKAGSNSPKRVELVIEMLKEAKQTLG